MNALQKSMLKISQSYINLSKILTCGCFLLVVLTSCAPSAETTPPDNPTLLTNLIKMSNPSIGGLVVTVDNSDPASPKLTVAGLTNKASGDFAAVTINIDQSQGITTEPTSFIVTAPVPISPHEIETNLSVTFEAEDVISYGVTIKIDGAPVNEWFASEQLSSYISATFAGQGGEISIAESTLSITGLANSPTETGGRIAFTLPDGFTAEPATIELANPDGIEAAVIVLDPNTFTITETANAAGNSHTYTIADVMLSPLTRFTPGIHIKITEAGNDITRGLAITEEAGNIIRIKGLTNKADQSPGTPNKYTLVIDEVVAFFTTPGNAPITRTITEPASDLVSGMGEITDEIGMAASTFEITNNNDENVATTYTLVVDFSRLEVNTLIITSADINGGVQTNVTSETMLSITTGACELLAEPMVTIAGGGKVADMTPFPRYYDRNRDALNDNKYTVTRNLTLENSSGEVLETSFAITMEFPACTGFPSGQTGVDAATAYEIDNPARLDLASLLVNTDNGSYGDKYYKITANIDIGAGFPLSEVGSKHSDGMGIVGKGFVPIGRADAKFTGTLDCDSKTISGLYINRENIDDIGLLGSISDANIMNCALVNVNITGGSNTGGLVGWNGSNSMISDSYATGSVNGGDDTGGLVGKNTDNSTISTSYANVAVDGKTRSGGLVGHNSNNAMITDSYATGTVDGAVFVGGLVGRNRMSTINNSYAIGGVSGLSTIEGLVGIDDNGTITASYWDTETSGRSTSAGGTGQTTMELQSATSYSGWLDTVWQFAPTTQYPRLKTVACANRQYVTPVPADCTGL
ncbi:hypothetical protein COTS27_01012 [Spirochaetota bacterium]|nr:hypothetical protein COTS27_01012 [Spirochaetota bacterium]